MTAAAAARRAWAAQIGAVALAVVGADQLSKWLVERSFQLGESLTIVPGFLFLRYVRNPGVAFGMFAEFAWRYRAPFFVLTIAFACWVLLSLFRQAAHLVWVRMSLGLIAGGAVGNQIDRFRYREVVDFIDCWAGRFHWPTFNVADSGISVGVAILLIALWREDA